MKQKEMGCYSLRLVSSACWVYSLLHTSHLNLFGVGPPCRVRHDLRWEVRPLCCAKVLLPWGHEPALPICSFLCWFKWPLVLYDLGHCSHLCLLETAVCIRECTCKECASPATCSHWLHLNLLSFICCPRIWIWKFCIVLHTWLQIVQVLFPCLTLLRTTGALLYLYSLQGSMLRVAINLQRWWCCSSRSCFTLWGTVGTCALGWLLWGLTSLAGIWRCGHSLWHTKPSPSSFPTITVNLWGPPA